MMRSSPAFFEKKNLFYKSRTAIYSCSYLLWGNRSTIARPIPQYGLGKKTSHLIVFIVRFEELVVQERLNFLAMCGSKKI